MTELRSLDDLFQSPYLASSDVEQHEPWTLVIDHVETKRMKERDGTMKDKGILVFKGLDRGLVLNKTNTDTLKAAYGSNPAGLRGRPVTLFTLALVVNGEQKKGIRILVPKPKPAAVAKPKQPAPPPVDPDADTDPTDEDYGFDDDAREEV